MGRALQLGTLAGIRIQVHWTFALLLAWVVLSALLVGKGLAASMTTLAFVLLLFACVVLHELGHALAARLYGIPTRDITLLPIGGVARLERMPRKPLHEFVVAVAGPAVNLVIAGLLLLLLLPYQSLSELLSVPTGDEPFLQRVMFVNLVLVVFNLLPAFPMDGGRVLRSLLASLMDYASATRVAAVVGQTCAIGFGLLGLVNPMLLLLAAFVFLGAAAESRQVAVTERLRGWKVRDAMTSDFQAVDSRATVAECAIPLLNSPQRDFPVVDNGKFLGMLRRSQLLQAVQRGDAPTIGEIAQDDISLDEGQPLTIAVQTAGASRHPVIPVTKSGALTGLIDIRQIFDVVAARSQLRVQPIVPVALMPQSVSHAIN